MNDENAAPNSGAAAPNQTVKPNQIQLINTCALGLLICFFLPWVDILIAKPSGFDLQKESQDAKALWLMPILAALTVVVGIAGKNQKNIAQLAGMTPFAILAYGMYHEHDLYHVLGIGAYLALILGLALFILPQVQK